MQLTGCHNDNEMRNAICVDTKISIEWPYCSFLYCGMVMTMLLKMFMMVNIKMNFTHTILPVHNKLLQISDQKSSQPEMH